MQQYFKCVCVCVWLSWPDVREFSRNIYIRARAKIAWWKIKKTIISGFLVPTCMSLIIWYWPLTGDEETDIYMMTWRSKKWCFTQILNSETFFKVNAPSKSNVSRNFKYIHSHFVETLISPINCMIRIYSLLLIKININVFFYLSIVCI